MRRSSAQLADTAIALWDLSFPHSRALMPRTRLAFVHLDNLLSFARADRDGRVDAYFSAYLPGAVVLLFIRHGEVVNAARLGETGRSAAPIGEALRLIRSEIERGDAAFHEAPVDLLAMMFTACTEPPLELPLDTRSADRLFGDLSERRWTGTLELISLGRVNYFALVAGEVRSAYYAEAPDGTPPAPSRGTSRSSSSPPPNPYVSDLLSAPPAAPGPLVLVRAHAWRPEVPVQSSPALLAMLRRYFWDLAELAERESPGEGLSRAERLRQRLAQRHRELSAVGGPRGGELPDTVTDPALLVEGVAAWTHDLLTELEVLQPQSAPRLLREACREHRYALAAAGFFERVPWRVEW